MNNDIGIKHDFLCINISCAQREVLKPEPETRGAQQMLIYQKSMFDCYYCIKNIFFENFGEIASKSFFLYL